MAIIWVGTGRFSAYIGPVQDYIDRVVAADVAAGNTLGLEVGVRDAYDVFIRDSINVGDLGTSGGVLSQANSIIKAAPIMAGARTLAGALVPLVGPAPTNFNFVGDDYNRKTGLVGNGSTKYLDSNRNNNADPQDSKHIAVFVSADPVTNNVTQELCGTDFIESGASWLRRSVNNTASSHRINTATSYTYANAFPLAPRLIGSSRSASNATTYFAAAGATSSTEGSTAPANRPIFIFRSVGGYTNARLAYYSIGESLNLALLDARITTLINAFAAVIP